MQVLFLDIIILGFFYSQVLWSLMSETIKILHFISLKINFPSPTKLFGLNKKEGEEL